MLGTKLQFEKKQSFKHLGSGIATAWFVMFLVLVIYVIYVVFTLEAGKSIYDYIVVGREFIEKSQVSPIIKVMPGQNYTQFGYDGQFCYFIALDPAHAKYYIDAPNYRYERILYPMLARILGFGQPDLIPYTLLLVNIVGIVLTTWVIAKWLKNKGLSPWISLVYAFYPGVLITLQRDLTEIISYGFVALAIYLFDYSQKYRILIVGISFALAILARETTAVFAVLYTVSLLFEGNSKISWIKRWKTNWRKALLLLSISLLPFLFYAGFLIIWLGTNQLASAETLALVPFAGLFANAPWQDAQKLEIQSVVVPSLICLVSAIQALRKKIYRVEIWSIFFNVLIFVIMLPTLSYSEIYASGRITVGVPLAAIFALPYIDQMSNHKRTWFWSSTSIWFSALIFLLQQ